MNRHFLWPFCIIMVFCTAYVAVSVTTMQRLAIRIVISDYEYTFMFDLQGLYIDVSDNGYGPSFCDFDKYYDHSISALVLPAIQMVPVNGIDYTAEYVYSGDVWRSWIGHEANLEPTEKSSVYYNNPLSVSWKRDRVTDCYYFPLGVWMIVLALISCGIIAREFLRFRGASKGLLLN